MKQKNSWLLTDSFFEHVKDIIPKPERKADKKYQRSKGGGRKPMDYRIVLEAIFFVLRTGIQWKALPKYYGSSSSIHRYFRLWSELDFF